MVSELDGDDDEHGRRRRSRENDRSQPGTTTMAVSMSRGHGRVQCDDVESCVVRYQKPKCSGNGDVQVRPRSVLDSRQRCYNGRGEKRMGKGKTRRDRSESRCREMCPMQGVSPEGLESQPV
jgi:hypothetical protein